MNAGCRVPHVSFCETWARTRQKLPQKLKSGLLLLTQQIPSLPISREMRALTRMVPGREEDTGSALDLADGENEPGVFRDDVGDQEVHLAGQVGDGSIVRAAMRADAIQPAEHRGRGFN